MFEASAGTINRRSKSLSASLQSPILLACSLQWAPALPILAADF